MVQIENQLRDFARNNVELFWQRQATLAGASLLAAYYINSKTALICYLLVFLADLIDIRIIKRVLAWDGNDQRQAEFFVNQLTISSIFVSSAIVAYAIVIAAAEGPAIHLGPLFFLLAATLYAAMNNCQIPRVLNARLIVFSVGLIIIPVKDIVQVLPPFNSALWMQLGVVIFVLYFLIECSRKFLQNYTNSFQHMEDLRMERDRVAEAYAMQSQFVSVVSHELRTPLTSIRASLDLLNNEQMGTLPDELKDIARIGQKSSNHLSVLIDDLLDFQKLNAGKMNFTFSKIELGQFVKEAAQVNRAFGDTLDVSIRVIPNETPIYVKADPDRMMQVIGNVLSNAIKFSFAGDEIEVRVEDHGETGRITIKDKGIGIPEDSEALVFGPFKQVDGSDRREVGGTGLGMSISRKIMESHGGSIGYVSELGAGTTFIIELDQYSENAVLAEAKGKEPVRQSKDRVTSLAIFPSHEENLSPN